MDVRNVVSPQEQRVQVDAVLDAGQIRDALLVCPESGQSHQLIDGDSSAARFLQRPTEDARQVLVGKGSICQCLARACGGRGTWIGAFVL